MSKEGDEKAALEHTRKAVVLTVGRGEREDNGSSVVELTRALTASHHEPRLVRQAICDLAREGNLFSVALHGLPPPPPDDRDFDSKVVGVGLTASGRDLWHHYRASPFDRILRTLRIGQEG